MAGLSFSPPTLLLNLGIVLVIVSAVFGGVLLHQFSYECGFDKTLPFCIYIDPLRIGILGFSFLGVLLVLAGFTLSIITGINK